MQFRALGFDERRLSYRDYCLRYTCFSFFLFFFFAKATGRTVRQIWTNEGSKRVVLRKEVPFLGLNDVLLNFGGKIPPKTKILEARIGLSSLNDKKFKSYNLKTT